MPYKDPDKQRQYQREYAAKKREAWLASKVCELCERHTDDLQIHHRIPEEKLHHVIWSWTETRREAELAKCEVLCKRCHNRLHARVRLLVSLEKKPCGTQASYSRGCRCEDCRQAHSEWGKSYRVRSLSWE